MAVQKPDETQPTIDTQGGAYVGSDVNVYGGDFVGRDQYKFTGSPEDARRLQNWQVMADKVYTFWVKGVLQDSLYENVLIELDMVDKAKAVSHRPWDMVVHRPDRDDRPLPSGTSILAVYQEMESRMLLLGEPGSGKTTMLLQLVKELIEQRQPLDPVPVVFNLSSWAEKQLPLEAWLVDELSRNYDISKLVGRAWVENDELSLFLDGLDEVRADVRAQCVQAINAFRENRASVAVCVCSRRQEYEALPTQLALNGAVLVRPLTTQQVEAYLADFGPSVSGLRAAWRQDEALQEMAESPMMLNIMLMAYRGLEPADIIQAENPTQRSHHLFAAYIERMFDRSARTKLALYTRNDTIRWLSWLARRMLDHSQTVFLLERLQPDWARSTWQNREGHVPWIMLLWGPLYGVAAGLSGGLIYGLSIGLISELSFKLSSGLFDVVNGKLLSQLIIGELIVGLIVGLIAGIIDRFSGGLQEIHVNERLNRIRNRLYSFFSCLSISFLTALLFALIFGSFASDLSSVFVLGLLGGFPGVVREVQFVSLLDITRKSLKQNVRFGLGNWLFYGLSLILLFSVIDVAQNHGLSNVLNTLLTTSIPGGLVLGFPFGLLSWLALEPVKRSDLPNLEKTQAPNEGIHRSARYALMFGLSFYLLFGLFIGLLTWLVNQQFRGFLLPFDEVCSGLSVFCVQHHYTVTERIVGSMIGLLDALRIGLTIGFAGGLLVGIIGGGDTFFKHYLLRFLLWRYGYIPLHYVRFLDYAAERIFLRKVGGGYIFIHRLVMEYFAELYEQSTADEQEAS